MAWENFQTNRNGRGINWGAVGKTIVGLAPTVGSVAGTIIDAQSQRESNRANARNVDRQIEFQREQNATAYQRAVEDMRAAGMNPALAYSQGGASSGSGAAAENRPTMQNSSAKFAAMVDSYNQFANGTAQRQLLREQANKTSAETQLTNAQFYNLQPSAILGQDPKYLRQFGLAAIAKLRGEQETSENIPTRIKLENAATAQTTATAQQQENLMRTQSTLNEQMFMNDWFKNNVAPYLNSTARAIAAIKGK